MIEKHLEALQGLVSANLDEKTELEALERKADSAAKLLADLARRRQETTEQRDLPSEEVRVLAPAWKPVNSSSFNPLLFVPPALIAFSVFGAALAVTLERLDRTLHSERDVTEALGIPCICLVPEAASVRRGGAGRFGAKDPGSPYSEAIRSMVVTALQLTEEPREPKMILVTSSLPSEGKTTLAVSFAACAARLRRRVLLLNFSLQDHLAIGEGQAVPQAEQLKLFPQGHPAARPIRRIADLGLDYLSVREMGVDPVAFLTNERAPEVLRHLRCDYDCVVIDGPPVFATAEARMLAAIADQVLFAVRWGKTKSDVAKNAVELLRRSGTFDGDALTSIAAVLTRVNLTVHARYRYGDSGEFLRRYSKRYALARSTDAAAASSAPDHDVLNMFFPLRSASREAEQ
jgi:Mrp family chromosome partitioning ATPase